MWACCWCCRIRSRSGSKSELRHSNSNRLTRRSVCPALCCLPITSSVINETDPGRRWKESFYHFCRGITGPPVQQGGTHTVSAKSSCGRRRIISYFPLPQRFSNKQSRPPPSSFLPKPSSRRGRSSGSRSPLAAAH